MNKLLQLVKADYQQRTRSYAFLITLCVALALGYSFVPPADAVYSTIRIGAYVGKYNTAWFGSVMALMSGVFISYFGYFIISSSIKRDAEIGLGTIMAATQTSNFTYLFAKFLSNYLVLFSLVVSVIVMGIVLFLFYGVGPFVAGDFFTPFILTCLPTLALVSAFAILIELIFRKSSTFQNILFSVIFFSALFIPTFSDYSEMGDPFGIKIITEEMNAQVTQLTNEEEVSFNIGYVINDQSTTRSFDFVSIDFPVFYVISRLFWVLASLVLLLLSSLVFHRFRSSPIKKQAKGQGKVLEDKGGNFEFNLDQPLAFDFGILPLIKAELKLLLRQQNIWLWIATVGGMVALSLAPISIAHQFILPVLWFIHVSKWSKLTTKEIENRTQLFAAVSYKPVARLFGAQLVSAMICMLVLSFPLVIRLIVSAHWVSVIAVLLGSAFVVTLAALLGQVSKSSKLFEVLFFILTYANLNTIPFLDYFGALHSSIGYVAILITLVFVTTSINYFYKLTLV